MDLTIDGCGKCMTWPCVCTSEQFALASLREMRDQGVRMVVVRNPRRPTRTHFFEVWKGAQLIHSLDTSDSKTKDRRGGRELTSINGVPIDQWRRGNG